MKIKQTKFPVPGNLKPVGVPLPKMRHECWALRQARLGVIIPADLSRQIRDFWRVIIKQCHICLSKLADERIPTKMKDAVEVFVLVINAGLNVSFFFLSISPSLFFHFYTSSITSPSWNFTTASLLFPCSCIVSNPSLDLTFRFFLQTFCVYCTGWT